MVLALRELNFEVAAAIELTEAAMAVESKQTDESKAMFELGTT